MKTVQLCLMISAAFMATSTVQAATVIDPLQNRNLWYSYAYATPLQHNVMGDPLGPDDGWLVQDNTNNCRWNYVTSGWNTITSVQISQAYYTGYGQYYFYGANSGNVELPNKVVTEASSGTWNWRTVSYTPTGYLGWLHINGTANNWYLLAGTVKYEVAPMLGNLISADTVDPMQDTSKWYYADELKQDWSQPGNINITTSGVYGDPLGPDDGKDACGKWANVYWASYKTVSGKFFGKVDMSFLQYTGAPAGVAYIQYWDGSQWVNATPTANSGPLDSSHSAWKWYKLSYDLTGLNVDMIRAYGDGAPWGWTPRIGTVDMKVVPEPATLAILGLGAIALVGTRRK